MKPIRTKLFAVLLAAALLLTGGTALAAGATETEDASLSQAGASLVRFEAPDVEVPQGTENFSLLNGVTAFDESGEPLEVEVNSDDGFDIETPGEYTVTYAAQHPAQGAQTTTRVVTVLPAEPVADNTPDAQPDASEPPAPDAVPGKAQRSPAVPYSTTINDVASLQAAIHGAISTATPNTQLTLSGSFAADFLAGNTTIALPALPAGVTVDINGQSIVLSAIANRHFTVAAGHAGSYHLQNLTLQGGPNSASKGVGGLEFSDGNVQLSGVTVENSNAPSNKAIIQAGNGQLSVVNSVFRHLGSQAISTSGNLTVENTTFQDGTGAIETSNADGSTTTVKNCSFEDIIGAYGGGIRWRNGTLDVSYSSFVNITNNLYNYWGGAIANHKGKGTGEVRNSYFKGNRGQSRGTAIGLYYFNGTLDVKNCYFEDNNATQNDANGDGGAVAVFNLNTAATLNISGSTFYRNNAQDDGGALFYEGQGSERVNGTVSNCTFVENKGLNNYKGTLSDSGGAVQLSLKADVVFQNNTFYKNEKGGYRGGAIGRHWHYSNGIPTIKLYNNLFVDNTGDSNYQNIDFVGATQSNNIGFDNGNSTALNGLSAASVFGTATPAFIPNGNNITAGYAAGSHNITIPTLFIAPNMGETGVQYADGAGDSANATAADQRGVTRGATPDAGAIDINSSLFDANGGTWDASAAPSYSHSNRTLYNEYTTGAAKAGVTAADGTTTLAAPGEGDLTNAGKVLLGWDTDSTKTSNPAYPYTAGNATTGIPANGATYYAIWGTQAPTSFTVTFNGNGATTEADPAFKTVIPPATTIDALPTPPVKNGFRFDGWNTEPNGTGTPFTASTPVTGNIIVYAQWTQLFTVSFNSRGGSAVPSLNNVPSGSTISAPAVPTRPNYTFTGWYKNTGATLAWQFSNDTVTSNITLYAGWSRNMHTVYYEAGGSQVNSLPSNTTGGAGAPYTISSLRPSREGYTFRGWRHSVSGNLLQPGTTFTMPDSSVTLTAQWRAVETPPTSSSSTSSSSTSSTPPPVVPPTTSSRSVPVAPVEAPSSSSSFSTPSRSQPAASSSQTPEPLPKTTTVDDGGTPLFGFGGTHWALFNLILSLLMIAISLLLLITMLTRRSRNDDGARNAQVNGEEGPRQVQEKQNNKTLWRLLAIIAGIAGFVLFWLTEDITTKMAFMDFWTLPTAILLIVQVVFTAMIRRANREENDDSPAVPGNAI